MPTGISGLYKNTKGAKAAERERLVELLDDYMGKEFLKNDGLADYLLANGVRVDIPRNDVSLIDGHIEE